MLDHLHVQHHVESLSRRRQVFGRGVAIVDVEPRSFGMDARHGDVALARVGAHHIGPQPRHRFAQEPAAAADVEQPQPCKGAFGGAVAAELGGDLADDILQPQRIDHVQGLELARRVPPFCGHRLELGDFSGIDAAGCGHGGHAVSLRSAVTCGRRGAGALI